MSVAKMRLALAVLLFAAWLGWLSYLVLARTWTPPVVLSRPQFLESKLDVIAQVDRIDGNEPEVAIREVLRPEDQSQKLTGKAIKVVNLTEAREDWRGPGEYIFPLVPSGEQKYEIAPIPRSPGYAGGGRPHIYPLTEETRKQYQAIHKS
jgi:hypothetical protein